MPKKSKKETVESKKSKVKKTTKTKASAKATAKTNVVVKIDQRKTTTARKPAAPQQKAPSTVVIQGSAPQPIYPMYNQMFPAAAQQPAVQEPVGQNASAFGQKIGIKPSLTKNNLESAAHFSIYPDWETVSSLSEPTFSWKSNSEYPEESSYNLSVPRSSVPTSRSTSSSSQSVQTWKSNSEFPSESYNLSMSDSSIPSVPTWAKLPSAPSSVASRSGTKVASVQEEVEPEVPVPTIRIGRTVRLPVKRPVKIPVEPEVMSEKTPSTISEASSVRVARQEQLVESLDARNRELAVKYPNYGLNDAELNRYAESQGLSVAVAKRRLAQRLREKNLDINGASIPVLREESLKTLNRSENKMQRKTKPK